MAGRNGLHQQPELQKSGWGSRLRGSAESCVVLERPLGSDGRSGSVCSPAVGLPGRSLEELVLAPAGPRGALGPHGRVVGTTWG